MSERAEAVLGILRGSTCFCKDACLTMPCACAEAIVAAIAAAQREPSATDVLHWLKNRPGISWVATITDIERAIKEINEARTAVAKKTTSPFYKTLNEEAAEGKHCDLDYRPDPMDEHFRKHPHG